MLQRAVGVFDDDADDANDDDAAMPVPLRVRAGRLAGRAGGAVYTAIASRVKTAVAGALSGADAAGNTARPVLAASARGAEARPHISSTQTPHHRTPFNSRNEVQNALYDVV